jgi:hypothetical protein
MKRLEKPSCQCSRSFPDDTAQISPRQLIQKASMIALRISSAWSESNPSSLCAPCKMRTSDEQLCIKVANY